jgi:hypothetical protein
MSNGDNGFTENKLMSVVPKMQTTANVLTTPAQYA